MNGDGSASLHGGRWTLDDRPREWFRASRDACVIDGKARIGKGCPLRIVSYVGHPMDGLRDVEVQDPIGNVWTLADDDLSWAFVEPGSEMQERHKRA